MRVFGTYDEPLFVAADVCACLGLSDARRTVSRLDAEDRISIPVLEASGVTQATWVVTEPGLYALVITSRKPEAKTFKKWVTSEVLPAIRKTGRFDMQE